MPKSYSLLVNNYLNCFTPKCILKAKIDAFERMNLDSVTSNWLGCLCSYVRLTIWFLEEECNIDAEDFEERLLKLYDNSVQLEFLKPQ